MRQSTTESRRADGVIADLRDISLRSAPALLQVVLGEFVLAREEPVWSGTLMRALQELEVEPTAARKAIQRLSERGVIVPVRKGRRAQWSITDEGRRMLEVGRQWVFSFTGETSHWDRQWLVVNTSVPETQRQLRHHLRTHMTWRGLGSPVPGMWITPHSNRVSDVAGIIDDLGLNEFTMSYIGRFGPVGDEQRTVRQAWDLDDLRGHYAAFIEQFRCAEPRSDPAAFRSRVELVQAWRRFPYLDPALPAELMPGRWIGADAARLFHDKRGSWMTRSSSYWRELVADTAES
jgi:phenylacetic acid degradation operon negative regulatory protein